MQTRLPILPVLLALASLAAAPVGAQNLIVNSGAESFVVLPPNTQNNVADFAGWTRTGNVYQNSYATFPVTKVGESPLPDFGESYFLGGDQAFTSLTQTVDLSAFAAGIDSGAADFNLSGWMGGRQQAAVDDVAALTVRFRDADAVVIGTQTLDGPGSEELAALGATPGTAALSFRQGVGRVPVGTRSAEVYLTFTRNSGTINNANVDNLSFTIGQNGLVTPVGVTGSGSFENALSLLTDGVVPPDYNRYIAPNVVRWQDSAAHITLDLGGMHDIFDLLVSVDNNDDYRFEFSQDGVSFSELVTVGGGMGSVPGNPGGMEAISTRSGDRDYIAALDFTPQRGRYVRVLGQGGDARYGVGEIAVYGSAVVAVPESDASVLFAEGLLVAFGIRIVRRRHLRNLARVD
jgi:hypothetical protein